ncbi:tetratricopeptide repeat protein, partial [Phormidium sp. CCY1219]|uniref:tetratricopeptide repeat protein n=1 Tax=Phormidium sp. CCY1219 TaxID=2886104 RepID=UPI002D1ED80F
IEDYNQAIRLDSNYALAYNNRGIARHDLGDLEAAIEDYNQAIRLDSNYAHAYYNRGIAYRQLGEKAKALDSFRQAATLYQQQGRTEDYQDARNRIRELQE